MEPSDATHANAFWDHMQFTTGARHASWDTFSASFETFMLRRFAESLTRMPANTPVGMVLRYAFDRGNPARAAVSERVTPRQLTEFLQRFGPMRICLLKAARSLFDRSGCLAPWFHGKLSREAAARAIHDWEERHGGEREGVFLFRYSARVEQPEISFSYRGPQNASRSLMHCLINNSVRGYRLPDQDKDWRDLSKFVGQQGLAFAHAVASPLYFECRREIEERHVQEQQIHVRTPAEEKAEIRRLFDEAQTLVYSDRVQGDRAILDNLEIALDIIEQVVCRLRQPDQRDPPLQAKALRLKGDILWKLRLQFDSVESYLQCLEVVSEAEKQQDAAHEGSPVVTPTMLSHLHRLLAVHFLKTKNLGKALHHFSELIACITEERVRRNFLADFRGLPGFCEATENFTHASVENILQEGISFFRGEEFASASEMFERALCHARCIGDGEVEARALGNLATADYKTNCIPSAIRRYRTCLQLLRQQGNQVSERKILNYLVMCCIEAERWETAKLFLSQLSKVAVSEDNIRSIERLDRRIAEGMGGQQPGQEGANLRYNPQPHYKPYQP